MNPIPPGLEPCPRCGVSQSRVRFYEGGESIPSLYPWKETSRCGFNTVTKHYFSRRPLLWHCCSRCEYQWLGPVVGEEEEP